MRCRFLTCPRLEWGIAVTGFSQQEQAMRVVELTAWRVAVPLRRPFRHASATRHHSENLVIRCRLRDGTTGWGEGVPRTYVTGDSAESSLRLLAQQPLAEVFAPSCGDWPAVVAMLDRFHGFRVEGDARGAMGNPLRAAVELSVLDAFGKVFDQPLSRVAQAVAEAAPIIAPRHRVRYSTTIDAENARRIWKSALKMRLYGFHQCKVKVGSAAQDDPARLAAIRRWIGPQVDLRLDANEAWEVDQVRQRVEPLLPQRISALEQPVRHGQLDGLRQLRAELPVPVMLDESLTSLADAHQAIRLEASDLWNLRLSKCGGFVACLRLAALARQHGIGYQLGCHPGETGILSAAGRHWAQCVREIRYCEGSYDRHVLAKNLIQEDITFGYGGWAPALTAPGLGVHVAPAQLHAMKVAQQHHRI